MSDETRCPVHIKTRLYSAPQCNGKILRREPALASEKIVGHIFGPNKIRGGSRITEERVPYYLYECEKGHILNRPEWWADVPTVPPGTIKTSPNKAHPEWYRDKERAMVNKQHNWYNELSDEEKVKVWK
ncbi:MAG: hypothetical protein SVM80_09985 [Halobacteriota archaeon]|nr:hypothetical protein [Halobacteriota archaeon]